MLSPFDRHGVYQCEGVDPSLFQTGCIDYSSSKIDKSRKNRKKQAGRLLHLPCYLVRVYN